MWIVIVIAWVVGIASLVHVIAGSSETLFVVFRGERAFADYLLNFLLPSFVGNSIAGVALLAAFVYAQPAPVTRVMTGIAHRAFSAFDIRPIVS
jgi:formate/nitrite transporter FocA (FNT family)